MTKKTYFPNLDGLRFLAFLAVFFAHSFYSNDPNIVSSELYKTFRDYGHLGMFGVNFFFVLSGFLITYLLLQEKSDTQKINLRNFYLRRVLRIWPLFYGVIIIGFVAIPIFQKHFFGNVDYSESANIWQYLLFINNFSNSEPSSAVLGILWSIAVEEQFYLVWPIVILLTSNKKLPLIFLLIIGSSFAFRMGLIGYGYKHTLSCMSDLAVGSLFAYYAIYSQRFIQFFKTLPRWQSVLIYFVGIVLFFVRNVWADIPILYLNERLVFSFFFAFVILEQNYSESNYKIGKIKILTKLGQISYGLYMLHFVAIYLIAKSFDRFVGDTLMTVLLWEPLASLILSIVFAIISYNYFEKFFLGLKNKFQ